MTVIGEDTSERLDVIPAKFRVIVTKRPKLACRACVGTVVQEPAPARLIEGGIPTEALVAHVLVARYADHLPLYRQAQIMARQGVNLDLSTLSFWTGYLPPSLRPWWRGCGRFCWGPPGCSPTRPWCRCSIPAAGGPSRATSGRLHVTIEPGAEINRRPWSTAMRLVGGISSQHPARRLSRCSAVRRL